MRILSWNVNGIRTLPLYYPWNTLKSCEAILQHLKADIICFQEMKSTRPALGSDNAVPGIYDGFFSFPVNKTGYSGVAVYTDSRTAIPLKAEEGLTGKLQPKPPFTPVERISMTYPCNLDLMVDEESHEHTDMTTLDAEGRAIVLDFGLFVLINVYCPSLTSTSRLPYKQNFLLTLQERVRILISEGREVIVAGDINVCAFPVDHADGRLPSKAETWYEGRPDRTWFKNWMDEKDGCMVDVVRRFWPERKGMFTCWETRISARETNYGTRIDYILVTRGLLPWVKSGDIDPSLKGSDHCPVYIDLHDQITLEDGTTQTLREAMHMNHDGRKEPPRIAAKFWEEFSGKQSLLSTFWRKKEDAANLTSTVKADTPPVVPAPVESFTSSASTSVSPANRKRKIVPITSLAPQPSKKQRPAQTTLSMFLRKPSATSSPAILPPPDTDLEADRRLALQLSSQSSSAPSSPSKGKGKGKEAWAQLLTPPTAPKCLVHGESAQELTTNKGPNKGKKFFICSRPVGSGYDKGPAERLREEVDSTYRCNFFRWSSDVKKDLMKEKQSGG